MSYGWRREPKSDKEKYEDDYIYELNDGKKVVIHQGQLIKDELDFLGIDAVGRTVWDASIVMSKFFEIHPEYIKDKRVVEVGAGTGLPGIVCTLIGASHVTLTEYFDLELLEQNVKDNNLPANSADVKHLFWSDQLNAKEIGGPFDVVLGSDVLYIANLNYPLLASLVLLVKEDGIVVLSYEMHAPAVVKRFYELANKYFTVEMVESSAMHPEFSHPKIFMSILRRKANVKFET